MITEASGEHDRAETEILTPPPPGRYFSHEFVAQADRVAVGGVGPLYEWMYWDGNLAQDVHQETYARAEFWPTSTEHHLNQIPMVKEALEDLLKTQANWISGILTRHAGARWHIYHASQPEEPGQEKRFTFEERQQQKIGLDTALQIMGLTLERNVIDYLFDKAEAVPSNQNPDALSDPIPNEILKPL